jgi:hypothetical protein
MRNAMLWKSLAGAAATFSLLLAGAGVSAAATSGGGQPGQPNQPGYGAPINCATAEHIGIGLPYHQIDKDCSGLV